MSKRRPSALLQSIAEAQETEKENAVQDEKGAVLAEKSKLSSPTLPEADKQKFQKDKKSNLQKVSCYLKKEQVEAWDEMTEELRLKIKKKKLEYKDIDRQVIVREIFDAVNWESIEQLLTAKRSNSRAS